MHGFATSLTNIIIMSWSVEKPKPPLYNSFSDEISFAFLSKHQFLKVTVECNFAEHVDPLNSDRVCSVEAARIIEDNRLIIDSLTFISFDSIPLRSSIAKEEKEVIV